MNTIAIRSIASHRNGVAGERFYVVLFGWKDGRQTRNMVATVFGGSRDYRLAVLDINETAKGNIDFAGGNSWRGDHFSDQIWRAIHEWEAERDAKWKADRASSYPVVTP